MTTEGKGGATTPRERVDDLVAKIEGYLPGCTGRIEKPCLWHRPDHPRRAPCPRHALTDRILEAATPRGTDAGDDDRRAELDDALTLLSRQLDTDLVEVIHEIRANRGARDPVPLRDLLEHLALRELAEERFAAAARGAS